MNANNWLKLSVYLENQTLHGSMYYPIDQRLLDTLNGVVLAQPGRMNKFLELKDVSVEGIGGNNVRTGFEIGLVNPAESFRAGTVPFLRTRSWLQTVGDQHASQPAVEQQAAVAYELKKSIVVFHSNLGLVYAPTRCICPATPAALLY